MPEMCKQSKGWQRPKNSDMAICRECGLSYGDFREIQPHDTEAVLRYRENMADIFGGKPEDYIFDPNAEIYK